MRLLHVICTTNPESGGPIESLLRISKVLIRDGHTVAVLSLETQEEAASRSFPFPVIGVGRGVGRYRYNPRLVSWLQQNAHNFDAIVLHGLWNYTSLGGWRALKKLSTPYFLFVHGMMDPWFRDRYPFKHIAKQIFWLMGEGSVLRDARAVLFTCEEERARASRVFYGPKYKERVVLYGTPGPSSDAAREGAAFCSAFPALKDRRFLLFLSRVHPKKGCDLLIRAFASEIEHLASDLDLVIAGPDQVGWVAELKELADSLGVAGRIHWPGMLKDAVKWGAFRSAEAFILPSHQENFGIVVAEAMSCSTPVLISDKVNIWREVEASGAGLVGPDSVDGMCQLIRRFYALSEQERTHMAACAQAAYAKNFEIEAVAQDFAKAIGFSY